MKGKKGAEMTIGTIIIIILALVVLVFLILGFSTGWQNLWDNIMNIGGGESNVQTIVTACNIACTTNSQYDYCSKNRDVNFGDGEKGVYNCKALEGSTYGLTICGAFGDDCLAINPSKIKAAEPAAEPEAEPVAESEKEEPKAAESEKEEPKAATESKKEETEAKI